jgi:hypothetical protein
MNLDTLLDACRNAGDIPLVYSKPLIELQNTLVAMEAELEDVEDEALEALVDAAQEVAYGWGFYPPEVFGSNMAVVDAQLVIDLNDAMAAYDRARAEADEETP